MMAAFQCMQVNPTKSEKCKVSSLKEDNVSEQEVCTTVHIMSLKTPNITTSINNISGENALSEYQCYSIQKHLQVNLANKLKKGHKRTLIVSKSSLLLF
jgi:hypothetical protein